MMLVDVEQEDYSVFCLAEASIPFKKKCHDQCVSGIFSGRQSLQKDSTIKLNLQEREGGNERKENDGTRGESTCIRDCHALD